MKKEKKCFFIDRHGNELPYGRYDYATNICEGWFSGGEFLYLNLSEHGLPMEQTLRKNIMVNTQTGETRPCPPFLETGFVHELLEGGMMIFELMWNKELHREFTRGVWDWVHDRPVLSAQYGVVYPYDLKKRLFLVETLDDEYELRGEGDRLVQRFRPGMLSPWRKDMIFNSREWTWVMKKERKGETNYVFADLMTGKECSPVFRAVGHLNDGMRYMKTPGGEELIVNERWETLFKIPQEYYLNDDALIFNFEKESEYKWLNKRRRCGEGKVVVECEKKLGVVLLDREGNVIIPPRKYKDICIIGHERLLVTKRKSDWPEKSAMALVDGTPITDFAYYALFDFMSPHTFQDDRFTCLWKKKNSMVDLHGALDSAGNEIIPFEYEHVDNFVNGVAWVSK